MKNIKIKFLDWIDPNLPNFNDDNIFLHTLSMRYNVQIVKDDPDILFYTLSMNNNHINYKNCIKIFYVGEPGIWDINKYYNYYPENSRDYKSIKDANYIISTYYIDNTNHFRLPLYMLYSYQMILDKRISDFNYFTKQKHLTKDSIKNKKFCTILHRNNEDKRVQFKNLLNCYKNVDDIKIPGHSFHKCDFIKNYKFTFAFENNDGSFAGRPFLGEGYTTEKIIEPMASDTIPLYWGNKFIYKEFNSNSFINWHDYMDDQKMIEKIIEIDNNDDLYLEMINQPNIIDFKNSYFNLEKLLNFFEKIIN